LHTESPPKLTPEVKLKYAQDFYYIFFTFRITSTPHFQCGQPWKNNFPMALCNLKLNYVASFGDLSVHTEGPRILEIVPKLPNGKGSTVAFRAYFFEFAWKS